MLIYGLLVFTSGFMALVTHLCLSRFSRNQDLVEDPFWNMTGLWPTLSIPIGAIMCLIALLF